MAYRLIDADPTPAAVRYLTFVAFLPSGDCVAVPSEDRLVLPAGEVRPGEHYLLDTCLRVPLETAGFRMQAVHPFAAVEAIADRLAATGQPTDAQAVRDGLRSFRQQDDASYYADKVRLIEPAYLREETSQGGSGFGGGPRQWRACREMIVDGIDRDGSFLDLGCANGLLMESVREWAGERGHHIEPYGVDLAPGLVDLARQRLPHWADRIARGNALGYRPGRRFTFVHALLDLVPVARRAELIRHALDTLVAPGGRLLVSHYQATGGTDLTAAQHLRRLGFTVAGESSSTGSDRGATTAWIDPGQRQVGGADEEQGTTATR